VNGCEALVKLEERQETAKRKSRSHNTLRKAANFTWLVVAET